MRNILVLLACLPLVSAETLPRFTDPDRKAKLMAAMPEVVKVFEKFAADRAVTGMAYGVVIDGELVLAKGVGVKDRTSNAPVTADTVFRIASMTKSFTALAILKLRDQGKLSLEDPVSKYVPEIGQLKYPSSDTAPLRVRQLLTHGAGFPEDNPWGDQQLGQTDAEMTAWLKKGIPFSTPPDTAYEYSNYGFGLLGRIVAKASGKPYDEYLQKEILDPLGMKASTLHPSRIPASVAAVGYRKTGDIYSVEPSLPHGAFGAMGGLAVSAKDLGKYVAYQLAAFPPRDGTDSGPVRRSSQREMQHPWRPAGLRATGSPLTVRTSAYGYGLNISRTCNIAQIVGHGGGLPGFGSYMMWLPEYGIGFIGMTNLTYTAPTAAMEQAIEVLSKTGALEPRELPPSPELIGMRESIWNLWKNWDEGALKKVAAMNLLLDTPAPARKTAMEALQKEVGACSTAGPVLPENLLRGKFRLTCERGAIDVTFTLAPTMPPSLQALRFAKADSSVALVAAPPACRP